MTKYLIIFYTAAPKEPELYYDIHKLLERVVELTRNKAKFTVSLVGECIGDFS